MPHKDAWQERLKHYARSHRVVSDQEPTPGLILVAALIVAMLIGLVYCGVM